MRDVSRETSERLEGFRALVRKWNPKINLIAKSTLGDLDARHINDSLQLAEIADPGEGTWVDLGSGGGFPGLVSSIACATRPVDFVLVESDQRKAAFLRTCARELDLPRVQVQATRIESLTPAAAEIVSARALAPLPLLMSYVERHLKPDGAAWLMKGENWQDEVQEARRDWRFDCQPYPSQTNENAAILRIGNLAHV